MSILILKKSRVIVNKGFNRYRPLYRNTDKMRLVHWGCQRRNWHNLMSPSLPSDIGSLAFRGMASHVAALAYKIATAFRDTKTAMRFSRQLWALDNTLKNLQGVFYQENPATVPPPTNAELESGILAIKNMQASFAEL